MSIFLSLILSLVCQNLPMMMSCIKWELQDQVQTMQILCGKLLWQTKVPEITKETKLLRLITLRFKSSQVSNHGIHNKADSVFGMAVIALLR